MSVLTTRESKRHFFDGIKRTVGCVDCGTSEGTLEFDHRDKTSKRFKVGASMGYALEVLLDEADKCEVRCKPCHTKRHHIEDRRFDPHYCPKGHARRIHGARNNRGHLYCRACNRDYDRRRTGKFGRWGRGGEVASPSPNSSRASA